MERYRIDENTIWVFTGQVKVFNYPPDNGTMSYLRKVYTEYKKDKFGHTDVNGPPVYLNDLSFEHQQLAIILATAQNVLGTIQEKELKNKTKI